jgi:hypothetical protein
MKHVITVEFGSTFTKDAAIEIMLKSIKKC